jgi:hypothetical protein
MKKCVTCRYTLINDRCPICGGRQIKGVERERTVEAMTVPPRTTYDPLPLYWSPRA